MSKNTSQLAFKLSEEDSYIFRKMAKENKMSYKRAFLASLELFKRYSNRCPVCGNLRPEFAKIKISRKKKVSTRINNSPQQKF